MPEASAYGSLRLLKSTPFEVGSAGKQPTKGGSRSGYAKGVSRLTAGIACRQHLFESPVVTFWMPPPCLGKSTIHLTLFDDIVFPYGKGTLPSDEPHFLGLTVGGRLARFPPLLRARRPRSVRFCEKLMQRCLPAETSDRTLMQIFVG